MSVDIDPTDKKKKKPVKEGEQEVPDEEAPEEEAPEPSPEASEAELEPEPVKKKTNKVYKSGRVAPSEYT